ncbi:MAG: cytochrome P450 [Bradyrhizobium sp.]|uniref:cytochrome P450 n=1 Tax=Bradyrhizobium sp. TaxID=376 RepID=UPI003D10B55E
MPDLDIMSPDAIADPQGYFANLRATRPVHWDPRYRSWLITSHRHVIAALRDERFSSNRIEPYITKKLSGPDADPLVRQAFEVLSGWMVFKEEPAHHRLRMLCSLAFTPASIAALRTRVEVLCDSLIDAASARPAFDLLRTIANPLTSTVIAEMLGVPVEDRPRFERWTLDVQPLVSTGLDDPNRYEGIARGMDSLVRYFAGQIERYRAEPADNLISALVRANADQDRLSDAELMATCTLLLFGGQETTANLIANSVLALLRHPEQRALLCGGQVDIKTALEEFMRYEGPGKTVIRVAREDFEFGGQRLRAGQRVFLMLSVANRDPEAFEEPERLKLDRGAVRHVGFGLGSHFCLGAPLARLEAGAAIPRIVERFPNLRLATEALQWLPFISTRGLREMNVVAG